MQILELKLTLYFIFYFSLFHIVTIIKKYYHLFLKIKNVFRKRVGEDVVKRLRRLESYNGGNVK